MTVQPIRLHAVTHLPGGSDPLPLGNASYEALGCDSNPLTIASGASGTLSWFHNGGSVLTDLTTPTNPLVLVDGIYVLHVCINPAGAPIVGYGYEMQIGTGPLDDDSRFVFPAGAVGFDGDMSTTFAGFLTAGTDISVTIVNFDSSLSHDFNNFLGYNVLKVG